jgi:SAM-dependent methyltransferase
MNVNIKQLKKNLLNKKISKIGGFSVMTDRIDYKGKDQVFPLHPEHEFFLDEIRPERIRGHYGVLDIGLGSGVLSIAAIRAGARSVVGLETNPRAIAFAGFNFIANGVEDQVEIRQGSDAIYAPVHGQIHPDKFDCIISNPPFEPTPPYLKFRYYAHSSGGRYGLDFLEKILRGLESHLTLNGHAQIVCFSPGTETEPFMLIDMVRKHTVGLTNIVVNPVPIPFDHFAQRFLHFGLPNYELEYYLKQAKKDGITHLHLCMIHFQNSASMISVRHSEKKYENWDLPIGSDVPMGFVEELSLGPATPKFTIEFNNRWFIDGVYASKCNKNWPRERLGKLIQICDTIEEADAILKDINSDWGDKRTSDKRAFILEVAPMVERNSFRTPNENEEVKILVIDPKG